MQMMTNFRGSYKLKELFKSLQKAETLLQNRAAETNSLPSKMRRGKEELIFKLVSISVLALQFYHPGRKAQYQTHAGNFMLLSCACRILNSLSTKKYKLTLVQCQGNLNKCWQGGGGMSHPPVVQHQARKKANTPFAPKFKHVLKLFCETLFTVFSRQQLRKRMFINFRLLETYGKFSF